MRVCVCGGGDKCIAKSFLNSIQLKARASTPSSGPEAPNPGMNKPPVRAPKPPGLCPAPGGHNRRAPAAVRCIPALERTGTDRYFSRSACTRCTGAQHNTVTMKKRGNCIAVQPIDQRTTKAGKREGGGRDPLSKRGVFLKKYTCIPTSKEPTHGLRNTHPRPTLFHIHLTPQSR